MHGRRDSNSRHLVLETSALPTELHPFKTSAEREGFEPPEPLGSTVFKTAAIDHSAISPGATKVEFFLFIKNPGRKIFRILQKKRVWVCFFKS